MKTIGLLGGMSWESTATYYALLNRGIREKLGGLHSVECILYSVEFHAIEQLQHQGKWAEATTVLVTAAKKIEDAGADFLLICTNTMHKVAPEVQQAITIPLLHIADATAEEIKKQQIQSIGLLGTRFTMEEDFYKGRLQKKYGISVCIPEADDREFVHRVIFDELCCGILKEQSRKQYLRIIDDLSRKGAQAVVLGCTEIALLLGQEHSKIPLLDTTAIHAHQAVQWAIKGFPQQPL